jgi:hypothetical protein
MGKKLYLQFGGAFCGMPHGPFRTVEAEWKESPIWWHDFGLSYTASGYGRRIPSPYMVRHNGRWRRVYVCQYGNVGTAYIGPSNAPIATVNGPY